MAAESYLSLSEVGCRVQFHILQLQLQGLSSLSEALALLRDSDEPDLSLPTVLLVGQEGAGKTCLVEALLGRSIVPRSTDRRLARWDMLILCTT